MHVCVCVFVCVEERDRDLYCTSNQMNALSSKEEHDVLFCIITRSSRALLARPLHSRPEPRPLFALYSFIYF